jgi:hypothetical protein
MREKLLEKNFREGCKKRGGWALKLTCPGTDGVPDRLVCFPVNRFYLVELKTTGKPLRPTQVVVRGLFAKLGIPVYVIDTQQKLNDFFKTVELEMV